MKKILFYNFKAQTNLVTQNRCLKMVIFGKNTSFFKEEEEVEKWSYSIVIS